MWCLGTWFSGGLGSARLTVGLDYLKAPIYSRLTCYQLDYSGPRILCIPDSKTLRVDLESPVVLSARGSRCSGASPCSQCSLDQSMANGRPVFPPLGQSIPGVLDALPSHYSDELAHDTGALRTNFRHMGR
ncbi:hypothetical protein QYF61_010709, partial [Mycteria americana]